MNDASGGTGRDRYPWSPWLPGGQAGRLDEQLLVTGMTRREAACIVNEQLLGQAVTTARFLLAADRYTESKIRRYVDKIAARNQESTREGTGR